MNIHFKSVLLFVKDVATSRRFYEEILGQKVEYDFGEDVEFYGGFAIHDASHISRLLFKRENPNVSGKLGQENFELYFESDNIDEINSMLLQSGVAFIHPLLEQPWGQRAVGFTTRITTLSKSGRADDRRHQEFYLKTGMTGKTRWRKKPPCLSKKL
jgi:catechol 2,3-dioxygenase-like lactoylglutathione lyase family enzyme